MVQTERLRQYILGRIAVNKDFLLDLFVAQEKATFEHLINSATEEQSTTLFEIIFLTMTGVLSMREKDINRLSRKNVKRLNLYFFTNALHNKRPSLSRTRKLVSVYEAYISILHNIMCRNDCVSYHFPRQFPGHYRGYGRGPH
jgi:hypothetical protein